MILNTVIQPKTAALYAYQRHTNSPSSTSLSLGRIDLSS
ncbi:hypothetical protein VCR31J2_2260005 [Vibrio coralliirubri]|uniref:Uncharacterized protein n=1 Tax=Vibrio coralliirubri TaxID=1516159 RepID=A0AA86WXE9_9VIBR|nr:hypothetical protein VCR31J2_2260005 [Vibrio coralliirubri]